MIYINRHAFGRIKFNVSMIMYKTESRKTKTEKNELKKLK